MQQSTGLHAAIIMDGNGRWAQRRGWDRIRGHEAGGRVVERIIEAAPGLGIGVLTLYAFSSDNWSRPMPEVAALMRLLRVHLRRERGRALANGVAVEVIGRRDRLPGSLVREIERTEAATRGGVSLRLRLAVDYSSRDAILEAVLRTALRALASRSGPVRRAARARGPRAGTAGRPADPHRRRMPIVGLSAVGMRLRRAVLPGHHVARVHGDRARGDRRRIPAPPATVWRRRLEPSR